ncbi:MAG: 1-acyl-sn-glycerol-3-phosphate acyltransferase [Armatimonadetes bacterium]|nr:1-acyl-sn-glycerol-3-phosphate acyltransferase [Armatimonadota bacterium]
MKPFLQEMMKGIGRFVCALLGGMRVEGREHVPLKSSAILVPNHSSDLDPAFVAMALPRMAWYMAKTELFTMRVFGLPLGPLIRLMQAFPVRREAALADRTALRTAEEKLKSGELLVLFPEGKLTETGALQPFQPGAALIALRTGVPVIPVGLIGTAEMMPYGKLIPRRVSRPVEVKFGAPLPLDDLKDLPRNEAVAELTRRMEAAVAALIGQPVPTPIPEERLELPSVETSPAETSCLKT